ncbi:MAG: diacylglycerol kinase [Neobacillus sp.]|jgi:undecaprenol kinase|nr:diacylglycerol kinase [Neobacillus sp.]
MASLDNKGVNQIVNSFSFAVNGIKTAILSERNMRIHMIISILVIGCSFFFSISYVEWIIVILTIGGMIALELVNTAIERVVDLITKEYHPLAEQAKDIAAGAVFVYAITAVIIGIIIFLPKIINIF